MEPFPLTCTTCKSRLKVRDAAAIGQIMACPKCGGMVLVKLPEPGATATPRSASDAGETKPDLSNPLRPLPPISAAGALPLREDAFDAIDELLGNVPARNMVPTPTVRPAPATSTSAPPQQKMPPPLSPPPTVIKSADRTGDPDSQAATLSQNAIPVSKPAAKVPSSAPVPKSVEQPQRAAAVAVSAAAVPAPTVTPAPLDPAGAPTPLLGAAQGLFGGSPWQYWAMVSASGLLGVVLAVAVVGISISWFSKPAPNVPPPVAQVPTGPDESPVEPAEGSAAPPAAPSERIADVAPRQPAETTEPALPSPAPPLPEAPKPMPPAAPETDPLGLTDPPPVIKPLKPSDDPLSKFDNILGGGPTDPMPAAEAPAPKPVLPPLEEEPATAPPTGTLPKPQPRQIDVAARLADPLPAIEISASPLADFLQVMQDLSTVPITLRPDGLAMVRSTPFNAETPLTWKGSSITVGEAISQALAPLGLEAKVEADQLIVDVASPQLITARLPVKDLTGSDEHRAADLAAVVMALVAADSWSEEEGQPALTVGNDDFTVRQHRRALAECVLLLEKLRVARGLQPVTRFDPKLFVLATRQEQAKAALGTIITLNYSIPSPLLRITDRLGKDAKVRILIDWQSLASAGWNPDAEATLTVEKQTLASALTDLTRRMELSWRVVDARTVQILSPQTLAERTELEFYPVTDLAAEEVAGNALVAKLRTLLGGQAFRDAGGRSELRYDAAGKCLIASLSPPQHAQVAAFLQTQRAAVGK